MRRNNSLTLFNSSSFNSDSTLNSRQTSYVSEKRRNHCIAKRKIAFIKKNNLCILKKHKRKYKKMTGKSLPGMNFCQLIRKNTRNWTHLSK